MNQPTRLQEYIERGLVRARCADWEAAAESFRKAAAIDPGNAESRYRLGWTLYNRSEEQKPSVTDLAVGYGAHMLGIEPIARDRGRRFANYSRRLREAAQWLREAISREPNHAAAHYTLAQTLRALGYKPEAAAMAARARELDPANTQYARLVHEYREHTAPVQFRPKPEPPTVPLDWSDLVLPARTKRELRQMQLMLEQPDLARDLGVDPPAGILLKGPPGTGKTTIARVLAQQSRCKFLNVTPADINNMYMGESEKHVKRLFEQARSSAPAIIFIDEIDALLPERAGGISTHYDKVVNQFLQEMDGLKQNGRVFVIGATNRPDMLDPAVRRGGRLSREIEIPLPDTEARAAMFTLFTRGVRLGDDVDLASLAADTAGFSGANLKALINEAGLQALIRIADRQPGTAAPENTLLSTDFVEALANMSVPES